MVEGWRRLGIAAQVLTPPEARAGLAPCDVAVVRLDVLQTLDRVEEGLLDVSALARPGVGIVNTTDALVAAHDKLETARRLHRAAVPHPRTRHLHAIDEFVRLHPPFVVKPRFGSWGRDVVLCETALERDAWAAVMRERPWFKRHGALVQDVLPLLDHDLRLLVAGGAVVGAVGRRCAPGDWGTNVSLGGSRFPAEPTSDARALGVAAATAIGAEFVGVDLLQSPDGGYVVIELNGAIDFDDSYSLADRDVYEDIARALGLLDAVREPRLAAGAVAA